MMQSDSSKVTWGLAVALMLVASVGAAQDQAPAALHAFPVSGQEDPDGTAKRITARVHNDSSFRVTDVRVEVRGLDAENRVVGRTFAWAVGDIEPGGDTSFVFDRMPAAVSYRMSVVSYDLVSGPPAPAREFR